MANEKEAAAAEAEASFLESSDMSENDSQLSNEVLLRTHECIRNLPDPTSRTGTFHGVLWSMYQQGRGQAQVAPCQSVYFLSLSVLHVTFDIKLDSIFQ